VTCSIAPEALRTARNPFSISMVNPKNVSREKTTVQKFFDQ
jgi:hypothetical protein